MIRARRWAATWAAILAGVALAPAGVHAAPAAAPAVTVTTFPSPFPADDLTGLIPERINERGQMIGFARFPDGDDTPVIWEAGAARGLLPGGERGVAIDLSDHGQVVGATLDKYGGRNGHFLWQDGVLTRIDAGGWARAINENGDVAVDRGSLSVGVWRAGSVIVAPGSSAYYGYHGASGINDRGQVAVNYGWGAIIPGVPVVEAYWLRAAVWQVGGGLTMVGPLFSLARAINEPGQVAGITYTSGPVTRAFLASGGRTIQLGTLGGTTSDVVGINDQGHVIGTSTTAGGASHAFAWRDGRMTDLGTLGGPTSAPTAINNRGQVVGRADTATGESHAVLWQDGRTIDLGVLASPAGTSNATDISEGGQISGYVVDAPPISRAVMWTVAAR
jgi:probable HAF family extracellular repeat protein